jgi:hypothetical protein
MADDAGIDRRGVFACCAFSAAALSLAIVVLPAIYAPRPAGEVLAVFARHRAVYVGVAIAMVSWAVVSVPAVVAIAALVGASGRTLARAALLLSAGGILLTGFAVFMFVGALLAIAAAAPDAAAAHYQAAIWNNLSFFLADPGLMALGLGQFLFAWLAWNGRVYSKPVSVVGFIGGLAGLLTLATYQTPILAILQLGAFGIWSGATGLALARRA